MITHSDLIALATYHANRGTDLQAAAKKAGSETVRSRMLTKADWHANMAEGLIALAKSFTQHVQPSAGE